MNGELGFGEGRCDEGVRDQGGGPPDAGPISDRRSGDRMESSMQEGNLC